MTKHNLIICMTESPINTKVESLSCGTTMWKYKVQIVNFALQYFIYLFTIIIYIYIIRLKLIILILKLKKRFIFWIRSELAQIEIILLKTINLKFLFVKIDNFNWNNFQNQIWIYFFEKQCFLYLPNVVLVATLGNRWELLHQVDFLNQNWFNW